MTLSPQFRLLNTSCENQGEDTMSNRDILADTPCEVQPGKVNNNRNGELLKWNQQFPKTALFSGRVRRLKSAEKYQPLLQH